MQHKISANYFSYRVLSQHVYRDAINNGPVKLTVMQGSATWNSAVLYKWKEIARAIFKKSHVTMMSLAVLALNAFWHND